MFLTRAVRSSILAAAATISFIGASAPAAAAYPDQPVRIIVPFPPGGSVDAMARIMGQKLGEALNQSFIVENRPGAGSNIGASYVAHSKPDGYTLLFASSAALAVNVSLYPNPTYDPLKDFQPVVLGARLPNLVVVSAKQDTKTLQELNALLKKQGDAAFYASSGSGTPSHLGAELYKREVGLKTTHVPYKGGAPALTDLISGRANFMIAIASEAGPLVHEEQLRALAVTSKSRLATYPDLPTVAESGVPGYEMVAWYGLVAPKGTPKGVVATLNKAFNDALADPQIKAKLVTMGIEPAGGTPKELADLMASETAKWRKVIHEANIKID